MINNSILQPEMYRVAAVFDKEAASKFSPEKDPFFSDENLYNTPVVFLEDVRRGRRDTVNDDVLTDEEVNEDYETELQEIKRKICGCPLDCDAECCSRNKCADACGCLCYEDNVLEYTPIRHPCWGEKQDFDLENVGHYEKQEYLSDGFDILVDYKPTPGWTGMITRMEEISDMTDVLQDSIKKMAVLAIKRYNKMFSSEYRIVNVVRANFRSFGTGAMFFITFVAAGAMGDGEPELFQGKVVSYREDRTLLRKVYLCRRRREVFIETLM